MKKTVALITAIGMVISLAACGGSNGTSASTAAKAPATSAAGNSAKAAATSAAGTAASSSKGGDIVIGCLQDITGNTSALGKSVQAGAQAAVDELNKNGGINGSKVVMKTYDTKGDVTEAVNAYLNAANVDKVSLIVGPPVANIANAIKDQSEDYKVPIVGLAMDPACQTKKDGSAYKNMFCLQPNANAQGKIMAAYAVKNGFKSYGIIYNQENSYSVSLVQPFTDELGKSNIKVDDSAVVKYGAADTDYKTLLAPIVKANVDAIYCPNYTQQLVNITTAARALGYKGAIICGLDGCPPFNKTYNADCTGVYYINNIDITEKNTSEMLAKIGDSVSATNKYFLGYDIVMSTADIIKKAGKVDYDSLIKGLENMNYKGLSGNIEMDSATHMLKNSKMFMYTYKGQEPQLLEEFGA